MLLYCQDETCPLNINCLRYLQFKEDEPYFMDTPRDEFGECKRYIAVDPDWENPEIIEFEMDWINSKDIVKSKKK